tara:strand:+ start:50 stop:421 length:372 start_codon:yes stop_codon:yes gene_type:complete
MSKEKKAKKPPSEKEQLIESYYMLARVIDHNTQIFNSFINMISAKEAEEAQQGNKPIEWRNLYTKEDVSAVLANIVETCGEDKAKKFLESFEADKISHLAPAHYEVFVKSGNYMVKHYKGDVI